MNQKVRMTPEETRRAVDAFLVRTLTERVQVMPHGAIQHIIGDWDHRNQTIDRQVAIEHWWDLARIGAIAVVGSAPESDSQRWFYVTEFGRALLERQDVSPHDRAGYLSAVRSVAGADSIAVGYADEAVGAWQAGLYRASAVMLGCACERLVLLIADAVKDSTGLAPYSADLAKMLTPPKSGKKGPAAGISEIFERVRGAVEVVGGDEFDRLVSSVFDHARDLRNASGHPTGKVVTREDAQAGLLLFPGYHSRALDVIERVRTYKQ